MLKAVIDTNVWISALLGSGPPSKIRTGLQQRLFQSVYSQELFDELLDVLMRPKYAGKFSQSDASELVGLISDAALLVTVDAIPQVSRDPTDDILLACATKVCCDFIVTGDADLLEIKTYEDIGLITPAQFVAKLDEANA